MFNPLFLRTQEKQITMKNLKFRRWILPAVLNLAVIPASAQISLVKKGKPQTRIIVSEQSADKEAANILQHFVRQISGAELPVISVTQNPKLRKNDIYIDSSQKLPSNLAASQAKITEDGFLMSTEGNLLRIVGSDKGSVYGVVTLLESYFDVDYWGENEYDCPASQVLELPLFTLSENPAFRYRQSQFYGMKTDTLYRQWHRLEEPREMFAASYWVHTFDRLLPSDVYGKEHPEYYSWFGGRRHPGKASQWCLTNPDVLEIVSARVDSIFKANPGMNMISVSQNDGNYTNCTCENCKKIDEAEGAFSGSLIYFMNKLAARFPDKEFSTLAYLYTMKAPAHIKPLPNVSVMLCDIDCNREVSLTENESGREFTAALEAWGKITKNLFVWDYGINFDNYLAPFPNFHILQDNIRLFKKNNTSMHFSQIAGSRGGDFAELRTYMVAKLMWNPELNADSLMKHFLNGYYGEAGPTLYRYLRTMEGALIGSGQRLWIYDSPVSHKNGMLKPELMKRYNVLFDEAENLVGDDTVRLQRVHKARLPLQYSELEIARTENEKDIDDLNNKLNLFEERVRAFNVPTLNERNNSPVEYCELYRSRYMPSAQKSIAEGATIIYLNEPSGKYKALGETVITDGLFGGSTFVESWTGWEGKDGAFVIDLGEEKTFHSIETDFLHQLGQWILLPRQVTYSLSADGTNFTLLENHQLPEDKSVQVKFKGVKTESAIPLRARYIKVDVIGTKECPTWHYGVGHPSWFFIDEVTVL